MNFRNGKGGAFYKLPSSWEKNYDLSDEKAWKCQYLWLYFRSILNLLDIMKF